MLYLLTATGARPEAFTLCQQLMAAQSYPGPVRWVIVDDGPEQSPISFDREGWQLEIIRPQPLWQPGQNTQRRNLLAGLERIPATARLLVIEDDDYYRPEYLATMAALLDKNDLVGECRARYYNVATGRGKQLNNGKHASLCSTGMKGPALGLFRQVCQGQETFIDMQLWQRFTGFSILRDLQLVVGIKGLPGRGGIGMGHKTDWGQPLNLQHWLGEAAAIYDHYRLKKAG